MKLNKLYHTLVIGGGALTVGCASTPTQSSPASNTTESAPPPEQKVADPRETKPAKGPRSNAMDCSKVCEDTGSEVICPEPSGDEGATNCCWLMGAQKHPCCPS